MSRFKIQQSEPIYKGRIIQLEKVHFEHDEETKQYDVIRHPGAVAILPITESNTVLLVNQWRLPIDQNLLEIPAGTLEENEEEDAAAIRELQEEVGYYPKNLVKLGELITAPGFCNERIVFYLATNLVESKLPHDDGEEIELVEMPLAYFEKKIQEGVIYDMKTVAVWQLYQNYRSHE